jgi:glycosyltransferase involved in cell wall biosynthesis
MYSPLQAVDASAQTDARRQACLPTVSFVIPVLNDATGLARCLGSIKSNDYPGERLEVIVVDNGSTDGSDDVAVRAGATVLRLPGLSVAARVRRRRS